MIIRNVITRTKDDVDEIIDLGVLIERFKKLRALNSKPDKIGLKQYTWHSFSIDEIKKGNSATKIF
jgi:hypothetical protein